MHAAPHITFGNADHQTQVGFCQTLPGILTAQLHALGQFNLLLHGQQGNLADFLQVHAHRVFQADALRDGEVQMLHIYLFLFFQINLLFNEQVRVQFLG